MCKRIVRAAVLLADTPVPPVQATYGDYGEIFESWLKGALESFPDEEVRNSVEVVVDGFDVVNKGEYPPMERLDQNAPDGYNVVLITGSKHTAHSSEAHFVPTLTQYVRGIIVDERYTHLKIVGICFGHQIVSLAMGGVCQRSERGWEIGVYGCELTPEGKKWFLNPSDTQHDDDKLHRDQVPFVPPGFVLCMRSPQCPVQGMVKPHRSSTSTRPVGHVLTLQGHPEYPPEMVERIVNYRIERKMWNEETCTEARRRVWGKDRQGGEGLGRVGWSVWRMILSAPQNYDI